MKAPSNHPVAEIHLDEIRRILEAAQTRLLTEPECDQLLSIAVSYCQVGEMLANKSATIAKLRKMLFGTNNEKTDVVLGTGLDAATTKGRATSTPSIPATSKPAPKGHGRNGADQYLSAKRTKILHEALKAGAKCPETPCKGILYTMAEPAVVVRVHGGPPLHAHVCELERLRCNLCSKIFTAKGPEGLGNEKYDATVASMIGMLRYASGMQFHRLERLESDLGVPLPTSTQWDIVAGAAKKLTPVFEELIKQAAQGKLLHNDDTTMQVLALQAELQANAASDDSSDKRTGIFTTGILAHVEDQRVALFLTGQQHAGENLADILKHRAADRAPPILMCDGLSRNLPREFEVILSNCLAHGRRQFVDTFDNFPEQCRQVLEAFREVYRHDAIAKSQGMTPKDRLLYHQQNSGPVMDELQRWLNAQIEDRKVEPNGRLGKAIRYIQKRWQPLTLFLRKLGAPLDKNVCEQALKQAIIHRKNSLFYKTENGARVGDIFMSLIHTARLCGANPFHYLTELQRNVDEVKRAPEAWLPWIYREALADPGTGARLQRGDPPAGGQSLGEKFRGLSMLTGRTLFFHLPRIANPHGDSIPCG